MLSIRSDRPIDPLVIAILRDVQTLLNEMRFSYFVCGAVARDILLRHVHGIETGIATADVDFGVAVETWKQQRLSARHYSLRQS